MPLALVDWHARFQQQAQWTRQVRHYLYERSGLAQARRVLDLGCGTGVLCTDLLESSPAKVYGLDILRDRLEFAQGIAPSAQFTQGDGMRLPYASGSFDISLCHFLLLWVADPHRVVEEMRRVTRVGGFVIALAEPDYGGRIDYPAPLSKIGDLQREALRSQGAEPSLGRRVRALFSAVSLREVEAGVLGGQWRSRPPEEELLLEWQVLRDDLAGFSQAELQELQAQDRRAWQDGSRILYVPTFYALGRVGMG